MYPINMSTLKQTHEELQKRLYQLSILNEKQRKAIFDIIQTLNSQNNWYSNAFHKKLKELDESGILSEFERKAIEKEFFPN